jgi:hypothetical protein
MDTTTSTAGWQLVPLPTEECLALLGRETLGRLAFVRDGEPDLRPITYLLHDGDVLMRVAAGRPWTCWPSVPR